MSETSMSKEEYDHMLEFVKQEVYDDEEVKYNHAVVEAKIMEMRMSAKITALDFANRFGASPNEAAPTAEKVVERAQVYYNFLIAPDPEDNEIPEEN